MSKKYVDLICHSHRHMPDPIFPKAQRYICQVRACDLPPGIPKEANPRDQDIDRRVYRDVLGSLLQEGYGEGDPAAKAFHLKNKGITILAEAVRGREDQKEWLRVEFSEDPDIKQGIVDGGHTYEIIQKGKESELDPDQFVKLEILVGLPKELTTPIAGGLNTLVQVQPMSLANLDRKFSWIKETLQGEPYDSVIAYKENEEGKELDIRDIISYLTLFNIALFPNGSSEYPINAYRAKVTSLANYLRDVEKAAPTFQRLRPILKDILQLSDIVSFEAREIHNRIGGGRAAGTAWIEKKKRGEFTFHFIDSTSEYRLTRGALFPMLGAFRWMVEEGPDGNYRWKGSFDDVVELWREVGADLTKITQNTSSDLARNVMAIGKSKNHWQLLYQTVVARQLMKAAAVMG